jgi:hypothetical protein
MRARAGRGRPPLTAPAPGAVDSRCRRRGTSALLRRHERGDAGLGHRVVLVGRARADADRADDLASTTTGTPPPRIVKRPWNVCRPNGAARACDVL